MGMNTTFGPSGILATPLMTTMGGSVLKGVSVYLGGLAISYVSGFGATYLFGHKNVDLA